MACPFRIQFKLDFGRRSADVGSELVTFSDLKKVQKRAQSNSVRARRTLLELSGGRGEKKFRLGSAHASTCLT